MVNYRKQKVWLCSMQNNKKIMQLNLRYLWWPSKQKMILFEVFEQTKWNEEQRGFSERHFKNHSYYSNFLEPNCMFDECDYTTLRFSWNTKRSIRFCCVNCVGFPLTVFRSEKKYVSSWSVKGRPQSSDDTTSRKRDKHLKKKTIVIHLLWGL